MTAASSNESPKQVGGYGENKPYVCGHDPRRVGLSKRRSEVFIATHSAHHRRAGSARRVAAV